MGGTGAFPLVFGAESCPSGGRAVSPNVIRSRCVSGRSLGSLFDDRRGYVPTVFATGLGLLSPDG